MITFSLINEKGGIGKTTLATHIAAGLAVRGYRVVLVDSDPQGHATFSFGLDKRAGLYDLLVRDAPFKDVLLVPAVQSFTTEPPKGRLFILPSNAETRAIPNQIEDVTLLVNRLQELSSVIDIVIFDTPPTPSLLHSSIYLATDAIIYPTTCEMLSFDGLLASIGRSQKFQVMRQEMNRRSTEVLGIVPTMYQNSTALHKQNLESLQSQFGAKVWAPLTLRTLWREASQHRCMVYALSPTSKAAEEAWELVNLVEQGMQAWQKRS
ncbi:MAG: ParA family protein [Anaerolineae bacterium]